MLTMKLDLGEAIDVALRRYERETGIKQTELLTRVGMVDGTTVNTIRKVLSLDTTPTDTTDREVRKTRQRLYLLAIALDLDPEMWEVSHDDLSPMLHEVSDKSLRSHLRGSPRRRSYWTPEEAHLATAC